MSDLNIVRLTGFSGLAVFAGLIFWLSHKYPYRKGQKIFRRKWFVNDLVFYTILQSVGMAILIGYFVHYLDTQTGWSRLNLVSDWPLAAQLGFFILTHDLFIYVFHRAMHKYDLLWRFHEAHHSVDDVDWVSGMRSHPFEIGVNQSVEYGAMILLGAAPAVVVLKGMISLAWGIWIHHNVNVKTGWLQYIINGSEMHRWHHHPEHMYTNFATKFAFWDWIFGTAYFPKDRVVERYGLDDPSYPGGYFRQFVAFFRKMPPSGGPVRPATQTVRESDPDPMTG